MAGSFSSRIKYDCGSFVGEKDAKRRDAVRRKTAQYLLKAEALYTAYVHESKVDYFYNSVICKPIFPTPQLFVNMAWPERKKASCVKREQHINKRPARSGRAHFFSLRSPCRQKSPSRSGSCVDLFLFDFL